MKFALDNVKGMPIFRPWVGRLNTIFDRDVPLEKWPIHLPKSGSKLRSFMNVNNIYVKFVGEFC